MCDTCGCNITPGNEHLIKGDGKLAGTEDGKTAVTVLRSLLSENDHQAGHNRSHFDRHRVLAINLMSSPGAGKTSLLEATIAALKEEFVIGVVEGDLETENDAERIRAQGVRAVQISTGSVTSNLLTMKAMMNSSHEKVTDRKKLAKIAGHSIGTDTSSITCHSPAPRSRAARSALRMCSPI